MNILHKSKLNQNDASFGGKVKGLMLLSKYNLNVPDFYVITSNIIQAIINKQVNTVELINEWQLNNNISSNDLWAVRSSASNEDGDKKSFAGQYKTVLNVNKYELENAIFEVINSYEIETEYSKKTGENAVIIQKMIKSDFSGVLFTKNPTLPYKNEPVIQIVKGLGDKLVSGESTGENIKISKNIIVLNSDSEKEKDENQIYIDSKNEKLLQSLVDESLMLEKQLNYPIDIEFTIENGILYWLQARPITSRKLKENYIVWDNTSVEANYPNMTLPLSISFVTISFDVAYTALGKYLGFDEKVLQKNKLHLSNMSGEIYGRLFYNINAWQSLLYLLPFGKKLSLKLPKIWGMNEVDFLPPEFTHTKLQKSLILLKFFFKFFSFQKLRNSYVKNHKALLSTNTVKYLESKPLEELKTIYKKIEKSTGNNWIAPVLNGIYTMITHLLLKQSLSHSKLLKQYPNFQNDILFSNNEVISLKIIREFQSILNEIVNQKTALNIFNLTDEKEIIKALESKKPDIFNSIMKYINLYGDRIEGGELKLETITFKQDHLLFISHLKVSLKNYKPKKNNENSFNYLTVIKSVYSFNFIKRIYLKFLINKYITRVNDRENYKFMRVQTFGVIRNVFCEMGIKMVENNTIDNPKDIFHLTMSDLFNKDKENTYKKIIDENKQNYDKYEKQNIVNRYYAVGKQLYPELSELHNADGLKGVGCCSGTKEGVVKIIDENTDFNDDFSDLILVANYFDPGWVNIFYQAKGVISERGNLLSHTAIICRELNLPSIVGVKGVMKNLKNGDLICMDGSTGVITLKNE